MLVVKTAKTDLSLDYELRKFVTKGSSSLLALERPLTRSEPKAVCEGVYYVILSTGVYIVYRNLGGAVLEIKIFKFTKFLLSLRHGVSN